MFSNNSEVVNLYIENHVINLSISNANLVEIGYK